MMLGNWTSFMIRCRPIQNLGRAEESFERKALRFRILEPDIMRTLVAVVNFLTV